MPGVGDWLEIIADGQPEAKPTRHRERKTGMDIEDFELPLRDCLLRGSIHRDRGRRAPGTLALHGGGRSSRLGYRPLLDFLASHGHSSASFDFAGQGQSGGDLLRSSLAHRTGQALAVAGHLGMDRPVGLIASSMGGHVACGLIDALAPAALVLYCPAAYEAAAQHLPFGPRFQQAIRATRCFKDSPAFEALERFEGRLLLVLGAQDSVIPPEVEQEYASRAVRASSVELLRLPGAGHHLHAWLAERPAESAMVFARVLATLGEAGDSRVAQKL
ncbi:putative magnesium chelatase accessory protein [Delftia tsuruhatensis]|uniref:alpha/beta fold hydrolase n=1 Tax=Delftia tsuruhatensis TaxID=180282 RepID=UPI001E70845E|nr:alpha/beta hydrolase [Delftia tsuruhatensis]CAB5716826.1 putative magnesium chelatase accessory protein [Delftia tsuruhatensis]CAC9683894.1 putative magnesium chelatase accessory protein [Delftia tsuruhatensis]